MSNELMGHRMDDGNQFCLDCHEPKGRIVAMGLSCTERVEAEDAHEAEESMEMEREN